MRFKSNRRIEPETILYSKDGKIFDEKTGDHVGDTISPEKIAGIITYVEEDLPFGALMGSYENLHVVSHGDDFVKVRYTPLRQPLRDNNTQEFILSKFSWRNDIVNILPTHLH